MTKQEEIREGLGEILDAHNGSTVKTTWCGCQEGDMYETYSIAREEALTEILAYLKEQGMVLKVDGELPKLHTSGCWEGDFNHTEFIQQVVHQGIRKAGYTLTEELI